MNRTGRRVEANNRGSAKLRFVLLRCHTSIATKKAPHLE